MMVCMCAKSAVALICCRLVYGEDITAFLPHRSLLGSFDVAAVFKSLSHKADYSAPGTVIFSQPAYRCVELLYHSTIAHTQHSIHTRYWFEYLPIWGLRKHFFCISKLTPQFRWFETRIDFNFCFGLTVRQNAMRGYCKYTHENVLLLLQLRVINVSGAADMYVKSMTAQNVVSQFIEWIFFTFKVSFRLVFQRVLYNGRIWAYEEWRCAPNFNCFKLTFNILFNKTEKMQILNRKSFPWYYSRYILNIYPAYKRLQRHRSEKPSQVHNILVGSL